MAGRLQQAAEARQLTEGRGPRSVLTAGTARAHGRRGRSRAREHGVGGMLLASLDDFNRWAADQRTAIGQMAAADGTVTILFSDIEGSTALNSSLGDARWVQRARGARRGSSRPTSRSTAA